MPGDREKVVGHGALHGESATQDGLEHPGFILGWPCSQDVWTRDEGYLEHRDAKPLTGIGPRWLIALLSN